MADEVMKLEIWSEDWGLPSVDSSCLAVFAYCKFSGIPVKIIKGNNPSKSPSGTLPILHHGQHKESEVSNILTYLTEQNQGNDKDLSGKVQADNKAFITLVEEKLQPACLHSWWIDSSAYTQTTLPWYSKASGYIRSFYIPKRMRSSAECAVYNSRTGPDLLEEDVEKMIYKDAKECLNILSHKLGDQDFFFGDSPTSFDAVVFGYLAPLLKGPLTSNQLVNHIKNCPNLCNHCDRILSRFFPMSQEEMENFRKKEKAKREAMQTDALEFPNKKRNMILAGIFAVTSMLAFAISSGTLKVVPGNVKSEVDREYDEDDD